MNYLTALLKNRCPRCREGNIFCNDSTYKKGFMAMNVKCPNCNQPTEIEVGFYVGTGYVSYALTVAISVASFIAWWILIGISIDDNRVFWWLGLNGVLLVALLPWLMRISRTIWLSFFVRYNQNWQTESPKSNERVIKEQMEVVSIKL